MPCRVGIELAMRRVSNLIAVGALFQIRGILTNDSPETVVVATCLHSSNSRCSKLGAIKNGNC